MQVFVKAITVFVLLIISVYGYFRYIANVEGVPANNVPVINSKIEELNDENFIIEFGIQAKKTVTFNGEELSLRESPYIENGVLMIPLQEILVSAGGWFSYNPEKGVFTVNFKERHLNGYINSNYVFVDNQRLFLLKEPIIKAGRVFVPIDFFVTGLGFEAIKEEAFIRLSFL
jgi:phage pi2 protein 07